MPRWLRLIWLWALLGLAAACSTPGVGEPLAITQPDVESAAADPNRPYTPPDVTLLGATGRPQFLNAYADW